MRSYTPNVKGLDADEPFQFQGGRVTPTLDNVVKKAPNSVLRLFFTVYPDSGDTHQASVEVEFLLAGKVSPRFRWNCRPSIRWGEFRIS